MARELKSYRDWLGAKLSEPDRAARYLNSAAEDSEAMFLKALRKVAMSQARPMTEIADTCGVSRESLYRMLSENGNPTSENRRAILAAMGLKSIVVPIRKHRTISGLGTKISDHNAAAAASDLRKNTVSGNAEIASLLYFGEAKLTNQAWRKPAVASTTLSNPLLVGFSVVSKMGGAR